ncbi:CobW family GTP-binding protein [Pukyongiella litopenaei]|uniref:GTP-binding protein n=1 Tax=Pukyongiella litopenaei TaxID=2605946 RepID=A0A2S0MMP7_9RHOB|nr:GTP-binding protein [Pukyongiella litopenaei]AVO37149.1 GTP-binding protein [Pukyongiella litopenaei]
MNIPVVIVSGYLGAGKTTLINQFLREPQGLRATVLVNDFGAINIDAALIENADGETIALTNGCACCTIGNDLLGAARRVAEARPDLLIVEASGVSEPGRLAMLLRGVGALAPARILTLINGARARSNATDKFVGRLFVSQIRNAHFISVNRDEGQRDFVRRLIEQHAPGTAEIAGIAQAFGPCPRRTLLHRRRSLRRPALPPACSNRPNRFCQRRWKCGARRCRMTCIAPRASC